MTEDSSDGSPPPAGAEVPPGGETAEMIGADLFRRLDTLDDRLQRSQQQMIALLDRKLNGVEPPPEAPVAAVPPQPGTRPSTSVSPGVTTTPVAAPAEQTVEIGSPDRPAWQSNVLTGAIAAMIVFVALLLVGLL